MIVNGKASWHKRLADTNILEFFREYKLKEKKRIFWHSKRRIYYK